MILYRVYVGVYFPVKKKYKSKRMQQIIESNDILQKKFQDEEIILLVSQAYPTGVGNHSVFDPAFPASCEVPPS